MTGAANVLPTAGPGDFPVDARPPRWGRQARLFQPRQPAYWSFLVLTGIGLLIFLAEQAAMSTLATAYALSWALMALYAVPVALLIYRLDLFEREPKSMLAAALVWGGVIATSLAGVANDAWLSVVGKVAGPDFATQWGAALVAPGVEETLKLMGVVTLFLIASDEFDGVMDGFVYGAMIGLGFTVVEDVSYFFIAAAAVPGAVDQAGPVLNTFLIRVGADGLYSHVLFTGLTGLGFAYLVTQPNVPLSRRVAGAALCVAAGFAGHAIWNSPLTDFALNTPTGGDPTILQWILWAALKGLPFLILLVVLVALATRSEEATYRAIVAGEPDPMVVTDHEMSSLGSLWARRSARTAAGRVHGPIAARLVGQLQAAQIEYAMIRSRSDSLDDPALDVQRLEIRRLRSQLSGTPYIPGVLLPQTTVPSSAVVPSPAGPSAPRLHLVPRGGLAAWPTPDGSRLPAVVLPEQLPLVVEARTGPWAEVLAPNGWRGWVDGRLLADPGKSPK